MSSTNLSYVLVTAARNERELIGLTIESVVGQTVRPFRWVIVSDGSTDGTDDVVRQYAATHEWIELLRMPDRGERHFGGKAIAFNAGYASLKSLRWDIIASLDADISFERDYFAFLLRKFAESIQLGVGGTPFRENSFQYDYRFSSAEHVSGACQLFRRECFEDIGGYTPVKGGGVDLIAVVTARMRGWQTMSFPEKVCIHHRHMGSGMNRGLKLPFKWGQSDYRLGGHPLWQTFRCVYQMKNNPVILGGLLCFAGYFYAMLMRRPRSVTAEFAAFRGREQLGRLRAFLMKVLAAGRFRSQPTSGQVGRGLTGSGASSSAAS